MGLARLLVFERLPGPNDRDAYLAKRRDERGRPPLPWNYWSRKQLAGNIKDSQPDDIAEWVAEDDVSNYHTFTVPYGPKYNAKRIERLLFTKDLLLNAEWNRPRDRETNLHRHPAFFGSVNDVIHDCCGFCPEPITDEDLAAAAEESKVFVSGSVSFIKDNPGRQEIGSFYPITSDDWTKMAYVGNTARLCQAIVDGDLEHVEDWCEQEDADVNRRDHTGRTPLQLAAMSGTSEIVQCLIDHGARLVARLVDGFTALHIAARRGNTAIVKALLEKSEANEEEEARKEDLKKGARHVPKAAEKKYQIPAFSDLKTSEESDDVEDDLMDDSESDFDRMTDGSFVKLPGPNEDTGVPDADNDDEPDVYDVNVLAWDCPFSPLHLAISAGHPEVIELLVSKFGANVLLPVKIVNEFDKRPRAAILTLVLALRLPLLKALETTEMLLRLGASSAQADMNGISALEYIVNTGKTEILDLLLKYDEPAAKRAITHLSIRCPTYDTEVTTPLLKAIQGRHLSMIYKLLEQGAEHKIQREAFVHAYHRTYEHASQDPDDMKKAYEVSVEQPIIQAAKNDLPNVVQKLLDHGADMNSLLRYAYQRMHNTWTPSNMELMSLLDIVQDKLRQLRQQSAEKETMLEPPAPLEPDDVYLQGLHKGTYRYWVAKKDLVQARSLHQFQMKSYHDSLKEPETPQGTNEKKAAGRKLLAEYEALEKALLAREAKTFKQMYPDNQAEENISRHEDATQRMQDETNVPYSTVHKFLVPHLTQAKIDGYHRLFQAAWEGNIPAVKTVTLGTWGGNNKPLQIAVKDFRGFSPFSIAVVRGHLNLARVILEIATVQYQPNDKKDRLRYTIEHDNDSQDLSEGYCDSDHVNVISELVDDVFTIDDIDELADEIRSKVPPAELLNWHAGFWRALDEAEDDIAGKDCLMLDQLDTNRWVANGLETSWTYFNTVYDIESSRCRCSLIRFAIAKNDARMLQFLTEIGNDLAKSKADDDGPQVATCSKSDFDFALRLGRTEMIGHLVAMTGASIPLQKLVETSGLTVQEQPKYYQGLSVYGKKRKDWADQGRGITRNQVGQGPPPLLLATFQGNLESMEYFLGDAPLRRYQEFAAANKDDIRIQTLSRAEGGLDKVLSAWLGARNDLAIHVAVMSKPRKDGSNPCLDFLIRVMPENIDKKSSSGTTPLQLAFQLNRLYTAKTLIAAGANQATRNRMGENLIHSIVQANRSHPSLLRTALAMLDQSLIATMLIERCASPGLGSLTPLALWIHTHRDTDSSTNQEILQTLLAHSQGADLGILDGAGDYPLNLLLKREYSDITESVINYKSSLLHKENAMGITPLENADNAFLQQWMIDPPSVSNNIQLTSTVNRCPADFLPENENKIVERAALRNWRMIHQKAVELGAQGKRQLVSLFDANEVARGFMERHRDEAVREKRHEKRDEVEKWMDEAEGFEKCDLQAFEREFGGTEKKGEGDL